MNSIVKFIHTYNDYVVVFLNLEICILSHFLAKPHEEIDSSSEIIKSEADPKLEQEKANTDRMRANLEMAIILYLNFLVIKQIILALYYDILIQKRRKKQFLGVIDLSMSSEERRELKESTDTNVFLTLTKFILSLVLDSFLFSVFIWLFGTSLIV